MNRRLSLLLACLALPASTDVAVADILYKCRDESGVVLYTNQKSNARNCVVLSQDLPVTTIAPPPKSARPTTPTPTSFPRVDGETQRNRDTDRRRILEQELAAEQQNLDKARKALAEGEAARGGDDKSYANYLARIQDLREGVAVHDRNVEALKRELANLK